jgi:hypothetical protein
VIGAQLAFCFCKASAPEHCAQRRDTQLFALEQTGGLAMSARLLRAAFVSALSTCVVTTSILAQAPPNPAAIPPAVPEAIQPQAVVPGPEALLAQGEPQVLEEGPIHEAFADPVVLEAKPRVLIDRQPPEPINELPPEVKPEGVNVEWIPGYWMWSDEQIDFVWVSGLWRDVPPGRRWVPGHWLQEGASFIWVAGFWGGADWQQVQMLPHPPATLDAGPSSPAPGDNFFWIPGSWVWNNNAYAWRPGYWYAGQQDWVWVPDNYVYTPAGSIFVGGYWDRPLYNRGLLFAPVYWPAQRFGYPAFYTPRNVVDSALLLTSLFVNTRYNYYWYGNGGWGNNFYRPWWAYRGTAMTGITTGVASSIAIIRTGTIALPAALAVGPAVDGLVTDGLVTDGLAADDRAMDDPETGVPAMGGLETVDLVTGVVLATATATAGPAMVSAVPAAIAPAAAKASSSSATSATTAALAALRI